MLLLELISRWTIPLLLILIPAVGLIRRIAIYELFVEGAKEGFDTAVRLIPFLVAMFIAIQVFRQSGAMNQMISLVKPVTSAFGIPEHILPLAFVRPLSGSGALALLANILEVHGPDSFIGRLASTLQGSTETTLYVITVYFGAVGVRRVRHAMVTGLTADLAGFLASIYLVYRLFT